MLLPDVNVMVHAFRVDAVKHVEYKGWLDAALQAPESVGLAEPVVTGTLRVVTHPRIFNPPTPIKAALDYANALRAHPNVVPVSAGSGHWHVFAQLCLEADARGNLVPDAYLAALAIESGGELVTADRGFARFPGLRWRHPLASR
jgi:toxin-antitoxin system PIN domain toxin